MKKSLSTWGNYLKRFGSGWTTKRGRYKRGLACTLRCELLESREFLSVYYVNATGGATSSDAYDGLSPTWTSGTHGPWQTVAKVNAAPLVAGDSVLFNRGQVWRESLLPESGDATGVITYGAYGTGSNPIFMGSTQRDNTTDWTSLGNNIWTDQPATTGSQLLKNPSFASNLSNWTLYTEGTGQATDARTTTSGQYDSSPAGCKISCTNTGGGGNQIQFYCSSFSITAGYYYVLSFRAKCASSFTPSSITLMQNGSPYNVYSSLQSPLPTIDGDGNFHTYYMLYQASATAADARIDFFLGSALPTGSTFYLDTLSVKRTTYTDFGRFDSFGNDDVGNIIFNNGQSCGVKRWVLTDGTPPLNTYNTGLHHQGDFYYNPTTGAVDLYSVGNPASYYSDIELALDADIINETNQHYVTYQNLNVSYGGAHGICGGETYDITVSDCDLSFVGGGLLKYINGEPVRYGNGIEFLGNAHDNLVQGCTIAEVYDSAVTNQGSEAGYRAVFDIPT